MTRSVEIPEAAVEAAALAMFADEHCDKRQMLDVRGNWDARLNDEDQALYRSMARAALTAALPYLAPAGDGGLREAQLRQEFRAEIMRGYQAALCNGGMPETGWTLGDEVAKVADNLLASLAAHPVAPAVPQPVDREALRERVTIWLYDRDNDGPEPWTANHSDGLREGYRQAADDLLAVLAGEQEQP